MEQTNSSRPLRAIDLFVVNAYYFSVNLQTLTIVPLLMPILVERFVGAELKGSVLGSLRLVSLMLSLLVHAIAAQLSDRCTSKIGRRRPFMWLSLCLETIALVGLGLAISYPPGKNASILIFTTLLLASILSNIGLGPVQGLIPDLVPKAQHGRYSAVKALFELPLPVIFVAFTIAKFVGSNNFWGVILVLIAVKVLTGIIILFIPEEAISHPKTPFDKQAIWKLVGMTLAFTVIIIVPGLLVRYGLPWLKTIMTDVGQFKLISAVIGVVTMFVAVVLGVVISTRVSLGKDTKGRKRFSWWVIKRLAFLVGGANLTSFVLYYLQERFPQLTGEAAAQPTAILMLVVGLSLLIAAVVSGWLTDKFGPKPLLFLSGVLAFAAILIIVLSGRLLAVYAGAAVIGISAGVFYSANWALGTRIVPRDEAGQWLGISNVAGTGAGAIGAFIGGPIGDIAGYSVLILVYGVLFLVSTLALFPIKSSEPV